MSEFIWQDDYKIGHPTVDAQHQHLFDLANKIVEAESSDTLTHLFMLFYQHIREHFAAEEQLMKTYEYPAYIAHVAIHNRMLDRLNEITQTIADQQWQSTNIRTFVSNWVLVHILEEDKLLGDYLKSRPELNA
jgi:hemerythrin